MSKQTKEEKKKTRADKGCLCTNLLNLAVIKVHEICTRIVLYSFLNEIFLFSIRN